jgi:hypothetical protein
VSEHLDEMALEALLSGRDDLVPPAARAHLEGCAECQATVAAERQWALDASVALRRAAPDVEGLDAMIGRAMAAAPAEADVMRAPSRSSLWMGAAIGGLAAAALGVLSLPGSASMDGLTALGRQGLTLGRAIDSVVETAIPGGWGLVAVLGLVLALLLAVPARFRLGDRRAGARVATGTLGLLAVLAVGAPARPAHAYRVEGAWPEPAPTVTLDAEGLPTSEALRRATESAGLGLVARLENDPPVTLHVRDVPLPEVVQALLGDAPVVVVPSAHLLTVRAEAPTETPTAETVAETPVAEAPASETPTAPPTTTSPETPTEPPVAEAPPEPAPREALVAATPAPSAVADRVTFGDGVEIAADEVVRDVFTMGGDARVLGRALGDVVTMGGNAEVVGEVIGNVTTMGGNIRVREGARVHGDLNAMGGDVDVEEGATLYGQVLRSGRSTPSHAALSTAAQEDDGGEGASTLYRWGLWHALLFLLGLVMLGTSSRERLTVLRNELGARPVRSAFGGFFGILAGGILSFVLVLTIIGSPGALVLGGLLFVAGCMGWTAVAAWLGSVLPIGLLKDRPVLQLAVGIAILFLLGLVPTFGTLITIAVVLAGTGAAIATNFGKKKRAPVRHHVPTGPFRNAAR